MDRKQFLKYLGAGSIGLSLFPNYFFAQEPSIFSGKKLTILHTNDQHSRIEPFDSTNKKYPNQGGFARRANLIEEIRRKENNVLLLDSGDIFQGTPYFNFFGGELEFKLMSMMQYDASTMGNHDFDNGLDGFLKVLPNAKFPFICSNYDFKNTVLDGKTIPYKIFNKNGIKVGIFGLGIELENTVNKSLYKETKYINPIEIAEQYSDFLKNKEKCHVVICLSHLGYEYENDDKKISDKILVSKSQNIDVILGGHTHTFLPKPQVFKNKIGENVIINQVGWAGLYLGRIDLYLDSNNKLQHLAWDNKLIDNRIVV